MNPDTATKRPPPAPPWMREKGALLHRICRRVDAAVSRGASIVAAVRAVRPARYDGRPFWADPRKRLRLAPGTLRRHYGRWRRDPRPGGFYEAWWGSAERTGRRLGERVKIPQAAVDEGARRVERLGSAAAAYRSMALDWASGAELPGIGRAPAPAGGRGNGTGAGAPLPFTYRALCRRLPAGLVSVTVLARQRAGKAGAGRGRPAPGGATLAPAPGPLPTLDAGNRRNPEP